MNIHFTKNKIYESRLNWAKIAEQKFITSLKDKSLINLLKRSESGESNAIVYGKSQVGKTSLILRLLGIKQIHYEAVSMVLRGGRDKGSSSTIMAQIYTKSYDTNYRILIEAEEMVFNIDKDVEMFFEKLRQDIVTGTIKCKNAIEIKIPEQYFEIESSNSSVNIIDLPGIESSDYTEKQVVSELYSKYLIISNVVIIVQEVHQIVQLNEIENQGIVNWRQMPDKFKIVLTRSVSNDSIKKELKKMEIITKDSYLSVFKDELMRNPGIKDIKKQYVYPIEYGESLSVLEKEDPELYNKAINILNELMEDLKQEIKKSFSDIGQYKANSRIYLRYKNIIEEKIMQFNSEIAEIEEEVKSHEEYLSLLNIDCDKLKTKIIELDDYLKQVRFAFDYISILPIMDSLSRFINYCPSEKGHEGFVKTLKEYEKEYIRYWSKFKRNTMDQSDDFCLDYVIDTLKKQRICFSGVINYIGKLYKIEEIVIDKLNIHFKKSELSLPKYLFSKNKIISDIEKRVEIIENELFDEVLKVKDEYSKLMEQDNLIKNNTIRKVAVREKEIDMEEQELNEILNSIELIKKEKAIYIEESKEDYKNSKAYSKFIEEGFIDEKNHLIQNINRLANPIDVLHAAEQLYIITKEYCDIKEHIYG